MSQIDCLYISCGLFLIKLLNDDIIIIKWYKYMCYTFKRWETTQNHQLNTTLPLRAKQPLSAPFSKTTELLKTIFKIICQIIYENETHQIKVHRFNLIKETYKQRLLWKKIMQIFLDSHIHSMIFLPLGCIWIMHAHSPFRVIFSGCKAAFLSE